MRIYSDPVFLDHAVPPGHPERPERLRALTSAWSEWQVVSDADVRAAAAVPPSTLALVHSAGLLGALEAQTPESGLASIDPDTHMGPDSLRAAQRAAGAVVDGVAALLEGAVQRVFCAVRPPGHHAERNAAMGFCLFNSVAVGAAAALARPGVERIAVLDFDVHHGNGTVDIFRDDPRVLVCSSFQHPFYPNRQIDVPAAHLIYTPLPAGTGSSAFRQAIERDWLPALQAHQPDLILVSAGFDGHADDPLAQLELTTDDFSWVTALIVDQAERYCSGRVLSTLEGGYDLSALCASVRAHLEALEPTDAPS